MQDNLTETTVKGQTICYSNFTNSTAFNFLKLNQSLPFITSNILRMIIISKLPLYRRNNLMYSHKTLAIQLFPAYKFHTFCNEIYQII